MLHPDEELTYLPNLLRSVGMQNSVVVLGSDLLLLNQANVHLPPAAHSAPRCSPQVRVRPRHEDTCTRIFTAAEF